ncbi:MAG: dipeptidyl aminopeptidase/acylaminoacyl peptidase, partial [Saprospiraceae bacterium]
SSGMSKSLAVGEYQYEKLAISDDGTQAAFLQDKNDPKSYISGFQLKYWENNPDSAAIAVSAEDLNDDWIVNQHQEIRFSQDGSKLFFHTSPPPIVKDTMLLEEEIIQVEIWSYKDQRLQTQQNVEQEEDEKKGYAAVYHTSSNRFFQLATHKVSEVSFGDNKDQNHRFAFGSNSAPYMKAVTWEGFPFRADISLVDLNTGNQKSIVRAVRGRGDLSPDGKYLHWYNVEDTAYYVYNIASEEVHNISEVIPTSIVDELDDHPDFPRPYGIAGWTEGDNHVLIYDRYDIWKIDPSAPSTATVITNGRNSKDRFRIRKLDSDRTYVDFDLDLIHGFNESSKQESIVQLNDNNQVKVLLKKSGQLRDIQKAKDSDKLIYSIQSHAQSPDIQLTDMGFTNSIQVSDVNPQQKHKKWSTVEMIEWASLDGVPLEGLLYKPEDFDSTIQYPMIVYFYERNSDNIHRYWGATPIRSIINPAFYASRGYIVFIPDIVYRDGYPGPSCYNAVMPGVTHLLNEGFIDIDRIGMQGHSWGGYQTAYLATRTNLFACAESGAPVANMTSAYGGIRWGSGLSRMFQYERTQTRIAGSLWEVPMRYFENSPIFFVDKINTPMLLMHNDHDTAVPWYQGIELFGALRRLDKPVWMLNYNNEPHWPTKYENIVDFNIRMQQFFDHYLMGKEMPTWMDAGVPAIEKGYNKGY